MDSLRNHSKATPPESVCSSIAPVGPARRFVFLLLAGLFFTLGAVGVVLPGIPATPFLLLTSYFLVRSWPAANQWLLQSRIFGPILVDWQQRGGVRRAVKVWTVLLVTLVVLLTVWRGGLPLPLTGAILLFALTGIVIVLRLPEPAGR